MAGINLHNVEFIKSAATEEGVLRDGRPCLVFAGRSNAGKSSVINRLLNRNKLAFVSKKPGKTIHVNYFLLDNKLYLADLPGYGFARVSGEEKMRWARLIEHFLNTADNLQKGVLIVDIRHTPTEDDLLMADYFAKRGIPYVVVANKSDKLKKREVEPARALVEAAFAPKAPAKVLAFSAESGEGRDELLADLFDFGN